jgi:hypothetical protein
VKKKPRKLELKAQAARTLATLELGAVAAGCDTTSFTTEGIMVPTSGITGCRR